MTLKVTHKSAMRCYVTRLCEIAFMNSLFHMHFVEMMTFLKAVYPNPFESLDKHCCTIELELCAGFVFYAFLNVSHTFRTVI